jgi:hypothetical protein
MPDTRRKTEQKIGLYGILISRKYYPQYKVAKQLRIWSPRLSDYAYGRRPIPDIVLLRMCDYFNVPPEEILAPFEPIEV